MADDKPKKPIWKRWWVWVIGIFLLIGIGSNGDDAADGSSTPATVAGEVSPDGAQAAPEPALNVGDQFTLGDFTYVIDGVEVENQIGNEFINEQASAGASFVVVSFRIRNEGNETETVMSDDFKIVDQRGREFRTSSSATTALSMSGNSDFLLSELQPGILKQSMTAFEVPDDVIQGGFTLVIPQKGFSSDEARIAIQP